MRDEVLWAGVRVVRFDIPPDSPLVDEREEIDVFAADHAVIIVGMHVAALVALALPSWGGLVALCVGHIVFWLGIPLGFHKLLAHRSYVAPSWFLRVLATLGTLTFQGGPLLWAATHRAHHRHTDAAGDAHASVRGFWWSHMGWTLYRRPNGFFYRRSRGLIPDLLSDPYLRFLDRYAVAVNLALFLVAAAVIRRWDILLWGFPLRIVVDWHITWLINSYAHYAPLRGAKARDGIRNSPTLAALAFGEGWHGNHHRFPGRANFAVERGQVDLAYLTLCALQRLGVIQIRQQADPTPASSR